MSTIDNKKSEPTREEIDQVEGPVLLEFGSAQCGHCRTLAPRLKQLLEEFPEVQHIKVEDASGKPLGRSFKVKLWPNLVFLQAGEVVQQLARPEIDEVRKGLEAISSERPT